MQDKISNPKCVMIVIFRSKNSAFSYAALLELLTIHSPAVERIRPDGKVHLDIIELEPVPQDMNLSAPGVDEKAFKQYFDELRVTLGETFAANTPLERKAMLEGLKCFLSPQKEKFDFRWKGAADLLEVIDRRYVMGADAFFSGIAFFSWHWMRHFSLSGNNKQLSHMTQRLQKEHIFCEKPVSAPAVEPAPAQPKPAPAAAVSRPAPKATPVREAPGEYPIYYRASDLRYGFLKQTGEKEFTLLAGAVFSPDVSASCPPGYRRQREQLMAGAGTASDGQAVLAQDAVFGSLSAAACVIAGRSLNGKLFWTPCSAAEVKPPVLPTVQSPESPAPAGADYCRADGKAGRVRQTGRREFLLLAGTHMRKDAAPSCPNNAAALRQDILARGQAEDAGKYYVLKDDVACTSLSLAASVLTGTSVSGNAFWRPADASGGDARAYTLRRIRELFGTDEAFCRRVGELRRTGLPAAGRGAMDVAMAAILGGCNSVKSPAQINYYRFAIADMSKKAPGDALGATWTWSSNCKKALGEGAVSGKIDPRTDACYAALPEDTTLGEIMDRFARGEPFFRTKKNDVLLICLERFADLLG